MDNELNNYLKITGIINNTSRPQKTSKNTIKKIMQYNSPLSFVIGSEDWTIKARDARRITAEEIKYM